MTEAKDDKNVRILANTIADEVGRQLHAAGLPVSVTNAMARQLEASGVSKDSVCPSPFGLLTALTFQAAGGVDLEPALCAAAGIQFLIAAGDVLDDLQDGDPVAGLDREGPGGATELALALLVCSQTAVTSISPEVVPARRILDVAARLGRLELVALRGQNADININANDCSSWADSHAIIAAKSGSLGRAAAEAGARLASDTSELIDRCGDFGEEWAIVSQVMNDVAAVWPGGRPDQDIARLRPTLPLVMSTSRGTDDAQDEPLTATFMNGGALKAGIETGLREELFRSGAIHLAWTYAAVHHARATAAASDVEAWNPHSKLRILLTT